MQINRTFTIQKGANHWQDLVGRFTDRLNIIHSWNGFAETACGKIQVPQMGWPVYVKEELNT